MKKSIITTDNFLGGRIKLVQPLNGYRAGIDPIFLAASIKTNSGERVLDVGSGVGVAAISLATRCPGIEIAGLEIQHELVKLASNNISHNQLTDRVEMINGDLLSPPQNLVASSFDHVMTNPPYYQGKSSKTSPIPGKAQSNTESTVELESWVKFCLMMLKPKGTFTMIHRAERLGEILTILKNKIGESIIYPLWPGPEKAARLIIVQGRKNIRGEMRLSAGMILHGGADKYTFEAEQILRHAKSLNL